MSVESNPELLWVCFTTLCNWSSKLARHYPNQSDAKQKPYWTWSSAFSHAKGLILVLRDLNEKALKKCDFIN